MTHDDNGKLTLEAVETRRTLLEVLATLEPLPPEDRFPIIDDRDLLPLDDVKL